MTVLWILLVLFAALIIILPLIEKWGPQANEEQLAKLSRWFIPMVGLLLILSLISLIFR